MGPDCQQHRCDQTSSSHIAAMCCCVVADSVMLLLFDTDSAVVFVDADSVLLDNDAAYADVDSVPLLLLDTDAVVGGVVVVAAAVGEYPDDISQWRLD